MDKIKPKRWYSAIQAGYSLGFSRPTVVRYISDGNLLAIVVSNGKDGCGKRYAIKGEWIESFRNRYDKGTLHDEKYSKLELKKKLQGAIDYCTENNLSTIKELITSINKLDK